MGVGAAADVRKGHAEALEFGPVGEEDLKARAVVEERKAGALGVGQDRAIQSRLFLGIRHHKTLEGASIIEKMLAPFQ